MATFSLLHLDIIQTHILPRLDGCTLATMSCTTPELRSLSSDQNQWSHICHSTWPSTTSPSLRHVISSFSNGPRSFFSLSYPPFPSTTLSLNPHPSSDHDQLPTRLISAVDIFYKGQCIFSKVNETETGTGWFRSSPFNIHLLGPKEFVPTSITKNDTCRDHLIRELELSWIVIDSSTHRAVNVSSFRPVEVERRHWPPMRSDEVHVRFATVVEGHVMCVVDVTCVGGEEGEVMHVTEVSLKMEDLDGVHLNGKDSLGTLQKGLVLEGKRENSRGRGYDEGKRRYLEFLEKRRDKKERNMRREGWLDMVCVVFGVAIFGVLFYYLLICCSWRLL